MSNNNNELDSISQFYDVDKWFLSVGLITEVAKNDLFAYGAIVHPNAVRALQVDIDVNNKKINYFLYVKPRINWAYHYYKKYYNASNIFRLISLAIIKKRYGNLNFENILTKFVKDRCGKEWVSCVTVKNIKEYKEE